MSTETGSKREPALDDRGPLSYSGYLAAKKSVDDRALNQHVVGVLRQELASARSPKVLEVGAGIGTMAARLVDWGVLNRVEYTLLDIDGQILEDASSWLARWAKSTGRTVEHRPDCLHIDGGSPAIDMVVRFVRADLREFLDTRQASAPVDLLVANAFLDLVEVPATLPALFELVSPNGLYWFSVNFDGETLFLPEHASDSALLGVYHRSMDERVRAGRPAGDSKTGRHLFQHLHAAGASILASGSSDWVVHALDRKYPADEAAFVGHILYTIDAELNSREEVDQDALREWLRIRREQLERGELVYIAHQLDFVGRRSG
jgi:SAM-dependent methyltransferase